MSFLIDLGLSFYGLLFAHWLWKTGQAERVEKEWTPDDEDAYRREVHRFREPED